VDGPPTLPEDGHPSEKTFEEHSPMTRGNARASKGERPSVAPATAVAFDDLIDNLPGAPPTPKQRTALLEAYLVAPDGFALVVAESKRGRVPIALLTSKIASGTHLALQGKANRKANPALVCPECEIGDGKHVAGCSQAGVAA
jgi:hypothetical protein